VFARHAACVPIIASGHEGRYEAAAAELLKHAAAAAPCDDRDVQRLRDLEAAHA